MINYSNETTSNIHFKYRNNILNFVKEINYINLFNSSILLDDHLNKITFYCFNSISFLTNIENLIKLIKIYPCKIYQFKGEFLKDPNIILIISILNYINKNVILFEYEYDKKFLYNI